MFRFGSMQKRGDMILAGDIGGTNTRLALFDEGRMIGEEKRFHSPQYESLEQVVKEFLQGKKVEIGCFGVAGPVQGGRSKITNLPWLLDAKHISSTLSIPKVYLINDLEANAYGISALKKEELFILQEGKCQEGNQALIAAGTGLGEAALVWNGKEHHPFACEGGHTDFAPRNEEEVELFLYLKKKFGHVSYERVISGPGIHSLFQFLIETKREKLHPLLKEQMENKDPAQVISEWGKEKKDRACERAIEWFISLYGSEAGNLALKFFALGGVYIGGGIAPRLIELMKQGLFYSAFIDKGRFKDLLKTIPIWIILNDHAALLGAARYAQKER